MKSYYPFIALMTIEGFGWSSCARLSLHHEEAFRMMQSKIGRKKLSGLLGKNVDAIDWKAFERQIRSIEKNQVEVVTFRDERYPGYLRSLPKAPPVLFCKGDLKSLERRGVAVVGTRKPSPRGKALAYDLTRELSMRNLLVVSGLARGIDTAVHEGSLSAGGPTAGIMGTGVDVPYPKENADLMRRITKSGCLISEQLMGVTAKKHTFPLRNRLISAFSHAVVVVEAGIRSGALITARWALEQGREVGAVPGFPGDFRSKGVNSLLKQGAFLVESVEDILEAAPRLSLVNAGSRESKGRSVEGPGKSHGTGAVKLGLREASVEKVLASISGDPIDIDLIVEFTGLKTGEVTSVLTLLEMEGEIKVDANGRYYKPPAAGVELNSLDL